ncbi:MAG TPA: MBL fold metallo-hydrolase [Blastocatellia bacterium]|nr:MBL fold metallo-hydrolase [Blastocatellia bacterium]
MGEKLYLRQNVLAEPLINRWYAWSYLVAPATAAMYIANSHLTIMRSFVSNPQVHVSALKTPAMIGGPFINYPASRVDEIRSLMETTIKEQANMLELAEAVRTLDGVLSDEAEGYSLEPLYKKIPDALRGYVELVYDLNNNASIRFIEGLLYNSPYYKRAAQGVSLSLVDKDARPFVFSTPRLDDEQHLNLNTPFGDERLDELFRAKSAPQSPGYMRDALNIREEDQELFSSFFTNEAPPARANYTGDDLRIRYFGHACVLIESDSTSILLDPVVSYKIDGGIARYTFADLPETIDYVLITHNHQDHCMLETLLQLRHKTGNVIVPRSNSGALADPSLKLALQNIGFRNVREVDEMETIGLPDGAITSLPFFGEHADLNIRTKSSYLVLLKGKSVLCVADSNNLLAGIYDHVHEITGDLDVAFLGMECDGAPMSWLYGPLLTQPLARKMDQSRRFDGSDFDKAVDIIRAFNPKQVYVYAMGQEPWLTYLTSIRYTEASRPIVESNKLVAECGKRGIVSERLYGLKEILL